MPSDSKLPAPEEFRALFDYPVSLSLQAPADCLAQLHLDEQALTSSMGASRLAGFSAGRLAAKQALGDLGFSNFPVLIGEKRRPIWPASVRGSISHCKDQCLAVVTQSPHCRNLGIDVEQLKSLEDGVKGMIMTPSERQHLATLPATLPVHLPLECVFFSLKESIFKCLNPMTLKWIDFHQANITLLDEAGTATIALDPSVHTEETATGTLVARYLCTDSHVFSAVSLVN